MIILGLSKILHCSDPTVLLAILIFQEKSIKNVMLIFITTSMGSLFLYSSVDKIYKFRLYFLLKSQWSTQIKSKLNPRRNQDGLLYQSFNFQRKVVQCYRGEKSKSKVLCLPLLSDNLTTNKGTINVILEILINGYLLIPNDNTSKNITYFITQLNINKKYLLVVKDRLSHER